MPPRVRAGLAGWARRAVGGRDDLRLVPEDGLHLTLVFLGDRPLARVEPIEEALRAIVDGPVPLAVGDPLWLAPRRPHVLTVAIADPAGALAALHRRAEAALAQAVGHVPEDRTFRPHVTVARVRRGARVRPAPLPDPGGGRFEGAAVTVFRSRLGRGGAQYEALERVELPHTG